MTPACAPRRLPAMHPGRDFGDALPPAQIDVGRHVRHAAMPHHTRARIDGDIVPLCDGWIGVDVEMRVDEDRVAGATSTMRTIERAAGGCQSSSGATPAARRPVSVATAGSG